MITHIELFAGISGFGLGFEQNGVVTIATVEKDAKARALLQYHYPNIVHLDDVKTAGKHNLPYADIISFGSPCQDLSIAGKRKGLEGERSGLFWEAIRIVDECKPAFAVWENVADAISSNAGRDFALILGAFRDIGAHDIAWRTFDAQYFGVPQRRRRIFLVADFRGERAGQILFESPRTEIVKPRSPKASKIIANCIGSNDYANGRAQNGHTFILDKIGIRELTPTEIEKCQGFPHNWTAVNEQDDKTRYKQLGNAVCVNVSAWIGRRIMQAAFDSLWKEDAS